MEHNDRSTMRRNWTVERVLDENEKAARCAFSRQRNVRRALLYRAQHGELVQPAMNCFARPRYWNQLTPAQQLEHVCRALQSSHANICFTGPTAAVVYGCEVSYDILKGPSFAGPFFCVANKNVRTTKNLRYVKSNRTNAMMMNGIQVVCFEQMLIDTANILDFPHALVVFDSAMRLGNNPAKLREYMGRFANAQPNVEKLLHYTDGNSENGGESLARGVIIELGFMVPYLQVEFVDRATGKQYRVDFLWRLPDGTVIVGEFDGIAKYREQQMLGTRTMQQKVQDERERDKALERCGVHHIVHFTYADVCNKYRLRNKLEKVGVPMHVKDSHSLANFREPTYIGLQNRSHIGHSSRCDLK